MKQYTSKVLFLVFVFVFVFVFVPVAARVFAGPALAQGRPIAAPTDCLSPMKKGAELVALGTGYHTVTGELAGFDPCNPSVEFLLPGEPGRPLIIFVHGGGGASDNRGAIAALSGKGIALLSFDAYRMNGFDQPSRFWALQMTYEGRQRMIYRTVLAGYRWAARHPSINNRRIFLYGLSNGADVVANLAAVVDPIHVPMVFAEGIAGAGLGLPDKLRVPLRAIFGRLDNFGSVAVDEWRWIRTSPCVLNAVDFDQPKGNAVLCNRMSNPSSRTQRPIDWIEQQRAKGADIDTWFYEKAAHGIFTGPLRIRTNTWGNGMVGQASIGANPEERERLLVDVLTVVRGK